MDKAKKPVSLLCWLLALSACASAPSKPNASSFLGQAPLLGDFSLPEEPAQPEPQEAPEETPVPFVERDIEPEPLEEPIAPLPLPLPEPEPQAEEPEPVPAPIPVPIETPPVQEEINLAGFFRAIAVNDAEAVRAYVKAKPLLLEAKNDQGDYGLHAAVRHNATDALQELVYAGANLNAANASRMLPIDLAVQGDDDKLHAKSAKILVKSGSIKAQNSAFDYIFTPFLNSQNTKMDDNNIALHYAAERDHQGFVQLFIDEGADMQAQNDVGQTPLHKAVKAAARGSAEVLLQNGANPNAKDFNEAAAMHLAFETASPMPLLELLLRYKADPNTQNIYKNTPLMLTAVWNLDSSFARLLMQNRALVDLPDDRGDTPLMQAYRKKNYELARYLISAGANPNVRNIDGETPAAIEAASRQTAPAS